MPERNAAHSSTGRSFACGFFLDPAIKPLLLADFNLYPLALTVTMGVTVNSLSSSSKLLNLRVVLGTSELQTCLKSWVVLETLFFLTLQFVSHSFKGKQCCMTKTACTAHRELHRNLTLEQSYTSGCSRSALYITQYI